MLAPITDHCSPPQFGPGPAGPQAPYSCSGFSRKTEVLSAKPSSTTRCIVALSPNRRTASSTSSCVPSTSRRAPASFELIRINPSGLAALPLTFLFLFDQESGHPIPRAVFLAGKDLIGDQIGRAACRERV